MTVGDAIEIRDRAIALGLGDCCDECRDALARLSKLGRTSEPGLGPERRDHRQGTVGLGAEEAARYLRRQIGAAA